MKLVILMNMLLVYIYLQVVDYLCYALYEAKLYLWALILSTWLCGIMGIHMNIALVGWFLCVLHVICLYDLWNMTC